MYANFCVLSIFSFITKCNITKCRKYVGGMFSNLTEDYNKVSTIQESNPFHLNSVKGAYSTLGWVSLSPIVPKQHTNHRIYCLFCGWRVYGAINVWLLILVVLRGLIVFFGGQFIPELLMPWQWNFFTVLSSRAIDSWHLKWYQGLRTVALLLKKGLTVRTLLLNNHLLFLFKEADEEVDRKHWVSDIILLLLE